MILTIAYRKFNTINLFWVFFFLLAYQSLSRLNVDWDTQTTESHYLIQVRFSNYILFLFNSGRCVDALS